MSSMEYLTPEQLEEMDRLSAELAALPDAELGYEWIKQAMPQGQQLAGYMGGVYVPPSITQQMANAYRQQQGAGIIQNRGDKAGQLAQMILENQRRKQAQSESQQAPTITPGQAQANPVQMPSTTTRSLAPLKPQFPGMMPTGNRRPIGMEEDIFEVSMPYGGLTY